MRIAIESANEKKRLKILQVVPVLAYGGVEKNVVSYFNSLDTDKYMFDFISHGKPEEYAKDLEKKGCRIYDIQTIGQIGFKGYKRRISESIDVKSYDIVHIHIGHITGLYAKAFRELGARKIICHAHTTKCINPKHNLFMPIFKHMANRYSDYRLSCGVMAGNFCFGTGKFTFLPNGIDYNLFKNVSQQDVQNLKKELGLEDCPFIVGHIGHFSKPKNHPFIIKLMSEYAKIEPSAKFVLVGDGPDKKEIEDLADQSGVKENAVFLGVRNDIPVLMKMFDVFILPSLHEGLPVVSIEAQSSGTKCLLSENIDKTLDIGAGLVKFLPLLENCNNWVNALENIRKNCDKASSLVIHDAMEKSGYDIASAAQKLEFIYEKVSGNEISKITAKETVTSADKK
ncbi:MAG: glycosyltransferase [Clostridia bacterium]|nr:glycosyltransferase [Clostridia bacterium]